MNYYEHHLGDYLRETAHLSMLEDGAYRRLMDVYYIKEVPLPAERADVYRLARAASMQERKAVDIVLREFFVESPEGWQHKRCELELARYADKKAKAKSSANARWSGRDSHTERNANEMRTHSEGNAPRARPQSPDPNIRPPNPHRGKVHEFPPGFDRFWEAYPRKTSKPAAARAFTRIRVDDGLLASMLAAVERERRSEQWTRDNGKFIPHPATWLNNRRWEDEPAVGVRHTDDIFAGAV